MPDREPFNLFVYGTLANPSVFRAVLGRNLVARPEQADGVENFYPRPAVLTGYKKVSPDRTYLYAVPDRQGRIRGHVIGPLAGSCLSPLRHYEGRNYARRRRSVSTSDVPLKAVVFVGNLKEMTHSFGHAFRDPLKQEVLLRRKIDAALDEAQHQQLHTDEDPARRAVAELRGPTIRDIMRRHFEAGGISDYAIRHSIQDAPLPDFTRVRDDPEARALAENYLGLVVRQVLFNELEERIHTDFRYELDHVPQHSYYYERAISSLAALRVLNQTPGLVEMMVDECLSELSFQRDHLVDFIRWAVVAADALYDARQGRYQVRLIRNHMGTGSIPLGAELEFSNIGHEVIRDLEGRRARERCFDGFLYFRDFGLDQLTWKLGGHIDDHREKASQRPRRGFFELALGNLSIEANLSKPLTNDPWMLNQFLHEAQRFYPVRPHSVHISLQLRSQHQPAHDRTLPLHVMKCLFALAGDPRPGPDGRLHCARLTSDEIINTEKTPSMLFCEVRRRYQRASDETAPPAAGDGRYVQQFRFLRLSPHINYEPIILALKGLQLRLRPASFLTPAQYTDSPRHRRLFERLRAWGARPRPLRDSEIAGFLRHVRAGLLTERRGRPAHTEAYIRWACAELDRMLRDFNQRLVRPAAPAGQMR